jgi:hypothetical protein
MISVKAKEKILAQEGGLPFYVEIAREMSFSAPCNLASSAALVKRGAPKRKRDLPDDSEKSSSKQGRAISSHAQGIEP